MATRLLIDQKLSVLEEHLAAQDESALAEFQERLDMSWIFHDSSLEGTVLSFHELKSAIDKDVVSDVSLIPTYDEIRAHKASIDFVRECAANKKKVPVTVDLLKRIHEMISPDDPEPREGTWRKETPVHRLYFHDIAAPDKIGAEMKKLNDWLIDPEVKKSTTPLRMASKLHFRLMQIYPFSRYSGKLARLGMNLILLRSGYPPLGGALHRAAAVLRSPERAEHPLAQPHGRLARELHRQRDQALRRDDQRPQGARLTLAETFEQYARDLLAPQREAILPLLDHQRHGLHRTQQRVAPDPFPPRGDLPRRDHRARPVLHRAKHPSVEGDLDPGPPHLRERSVGLEEKHRVALARDHQPAVLSLLGHHEEAQRGRALAEKCDLSREPVLVGEVQQHVSDLEYPGDAHLWRRRLFLRGGVSARLRPEPQPRRGSPSPDRDENSEGDGVHWGATILRGRGAVAWPAR